MTNTERKPNFTDGSIVECIEDFPSQNNGIKKGNLYTVMDTAFENSNNFIRIENDNGEIGYYREQRFKLFKK